VLWASTGTNNPLYPDTLYIDQLIGPDTVNTVPPATLNAFLDHGRPAVTVTGGLSDAHKRIEQLAEMDIDLERITEELQEKGVASVADSLRERSNPSP